MYIKWEPKEDKSRIPLAHKMSCSLSFHIPKALPSLSPPSHRCTNRLLSVVSCHKKQSHHTKQHPQLPTKNKFEDCTTHILNLTIQVGGVLATVCMISDGFKYVFFLIIRSFVPLILIGMFQFRFIDSILWCGTGGAACFSWDRCEWWRRFGLGFDSIRDCSFLLLPFCSREPKHCYS